MLTAPASLRAGTNVMRCWRAMASRIGMLWIEITPKMVVTPSSARACAMRSPTGSSSVAVAAAILATAGFILPSLHVTRHAARDFELGTGDEARRRRYQERDRARHLVGLAQALQQDMARPRKIAVPLLVLLPLILAVREAPLPLP